jgi:single-strand selective monofunctional uracil DNA glycosylase
MNAIVVAQARAETELCKALGRMRFSPPAVYVYNPLEYASELVAQYRQRFGQTKKRYLLLGMNPGPFGMGQTGVPFGEVSVVRDVFKLTGKVTKPKRENPKRPVEGLACTRAEVSGARLWGAIQETHGSVEPFFAQAFVLNYCPLLFLSESGANVTPDKLKAEERKPMEAACDKHLLAMFAAFEPEWILGIGAYATKCVERALGDAASAYKLGTIPHPSPASPAANRGWAPLARKALDAYGISGLL